MNKFEDYSCGSTEHFSRRSIMKLAGLSGLSWLTPLAGQLAAQEKSKRADRPKSLIILWLEGAPSQLETFDPHPDTNIAGGSKARKTKAPGIFLDEHFEQVAEEMDSISLVRAITSKEGDHERAIYNVKTGFRPDPTLVHPSIGSVICHQLYDESDKAIDIPRHISIVPQNYPARGGYLGDKYDAFKIGDPNRPIPDVTSYLDESRQAQRLKDLKVVDEQFLQRRSKRKIETGKLGNHNLDAALRMMSSDQLSAFDVSLAPKAEREAFGDSAFGRGCLAAVRLIENGVRCVEITLGGWDSHANNHEIQNGLVQTLDPAFAATIRELKKRDLLDSTMVVCGGEFGRTPQINPLGGRDHWPHGFSIAMAGGGIQGGRVVGETNPDPSGNSEDVIKNLKDSHAIEDIHATIFGSLGIDFKHEFDTPIGRPMRISEGVPIKTLASF